MPDDYLSAYTFEHHPDPMWIYDLETLAFLEVNEAAVEKYGYSRPEFLSMTLEDIRPEEDLPALREDLAAAPAGPLQAGLWRHRLRDGSLIHVDINSHSIVYHGRPARLVSARDFSRLVELERENRELMDREHSLRLKAQESAQHFQQLFQAAPGKFLVLTPDTHEIVTASDAYVESTMTRREDIKGRNVFEVFPGDPDQPDADGVADLRASLERVAATGVADVLLVQRYPIPRPAERGGGFEDRYWNTVNTPVKNPDGSIAFIIHHVQDVTPLLKPRSRETRSPEPSDLDDALSVDILLRAREVEAANAALRERQATLRTAQRLLGIGVWKLYPDTNRLIWSEEVYDIYGVTARDREMTYDEYVSLVHPDDRETMESRYRDFTASNADVFEYEHRIVRPQGGTVHVKGIGERSTDIDGVPIVAGVVRDVTSQKETEQRIRESDLLLRIAGEAARFGAWRIDLENQAVTWSAETAAIHELPEGYSPSLEEAIRYYTPEHRDRIRKAFTACAEQGNPYDELLEIITAKGNRVWVRSIGEPEYDEQGGIRAVRGAFQDVSDLIAARHEAQDLAERLKRTLEEISDAVLIVDRDWSFVFVNSQAERMVERSRDELIGGNLWELFPEAVGSDFQKHYEKAMHERVTVRFTDYYEPLGRWFEVNAYPASEGLAIYFSDDTERRELEERLRQSQRLEAVGQLTGGIAHDFNNLLTVILGNTDLLSEALEGHEELRPFVDMIGQAADSGAALTARLLAFARRQPLQPKPLNVNRLVGQMDALLRRTLGEHIKVETIRGADLWITEIDPAQLENAMLNLAINARDAMPEGGRLIIETANISLDDDYASVHGVAEPGQYVMISVSDTGTGMPPEVAERAFEPFFTTKEKQSGSGLGLSMVYGFVRQSGGHAHIYSEPGNGSTIKLYFPCAADQSAVANDAIRRAALEPELTGNGEHVLVVEDDALVRANLVRQLGELGYRVSQAPDGPSALEILGKATDIDLLMTDVVMPGGMNGRELAERARTADPDLKVLYTSGYSENAIDHGGRLDPGVQLLSKPYRRIDLAKKVREVLDATPT